MPLVFYDGPRFVVICLLIICLCDVPSAAAKDTTESYPASFFSSYAPRTALDMVHHLPGFQFEAGNQGRRGFSDAGGNVLIDGERPGTKSGGLTAALADIPTNRVERIDIIRGSALTGDTSGRSVIANVVRVRQREASTSVDATLSSMNGRALGHAALLATRPLAEFNLTSSLRLETDGETSHGSRLMFDAEEAALQSDDLAYRSEFPEASGRLTLTGPLAGGGLNANVALARARFYEAFTFTNEAFVNRNPKQTDRWHGEASADWAKQVSDNYTLNFLALASFIDLDGEERGLAGGSLDALRDTDLFDWQQLSRETIFRTRLVNGGNSHWRPEVGAEVAWNSMDHRSILTRFSDDGPASHPQSRTTVSETRLEAFAALHWLPSARWALAAGAAYEASRIRAESEGTRENRFEFLRPRITVSYKPDAHTDLRLALRRTVGQLSFADFAASVNLLQGASFDGNPDLGPDHKTTVSLDLGRRFGERGAFNLSIYHDWRRDVLEATILPSGGFGVRNVASARAWGGSASLELPINRYISGGLFTLGYSWLNSSVDDPVTGEARVITDTHPYELSASFRQDLPSERISWGAEYSSGFRHLFWFADERRERNRAAQLGLFVETTRFLDSRMRLQANSLTGSRDTYHRFLYSPDRSGSFYQREIWDIKTPVTITFSISRNY